ncbi:MAG: isoprenylcysteine carboxylmethyltransferase family protein [Anaerolineae bacterium]|nr:isoprenylcysteine carboxylmethyltransferase family protein [Anaerolineae bacterium]
MSKSHWWQGKRGEWYVIVQFLLLGLLVFGPTTMGNIPLWSPPWSTVGIVAGLILGAIGALLVAAGLISLGNNLTAVPFPKENAQLVRNRAYSIVRHPIYSGIIIGSFGLALLRGSWLTLLYAMLIFLFFDIKSRKEETWLSERFAGYGDYQKRVRKLIPFLY